jgi:hypothetical protein
LNIKGRGEGVVESDGGNYGEGGRDRVMEREGRDGWRGEGGMEGGGEGGMESDGGERE